MFGDCSNCVLTSYYSTTSDTNTLVETVSFAALSKIQPFLVSITTSSVLLMDFHCHLTKTEVCGYLGGSWDLNSHSKFVWPLDALA